MAELLPFYEKFPAEVIAITARGSDPNDGENRVPLLLKAEAERNTAHWYAAAALVRPQELVHRLLGQARFDYAISILDQDFIPVRVLDPAPRAPLASSLALAASPPPVLGVAWPPDTAYYIETSGDESRVLTCCVGARTYLKEGRAIIHGSANQQPPDLAWEDHDREIVRILLTFAHCRLCSFAGDDFPNIRGGKASIVWHSPGQAGHLLEEAVEQYVQECVRMVAALHEEMVSEREIRAKVRLWIRDSRNVRTEAIPVINGGVEVNHCAPIQHLTTNGRCVD